MKTGYELNDVGRTLSWEALDSFLKHAAPDSALIKQLDPETAAWASTIKTNAILADIFDILATINANLMAVGSGKAARRPKPYPRPGKRSPDNEQHFGSGALPPDELRKWIEEKRNANSSTGDHTGNASP